MYSQDSFFTLPIFGQIGLVLVSVTLAAVFLWLSVVAGRRIQWPIKIVVSFALLTLFVWFSPQIYYAYYMLIFTELPFQWVLKMPPGPVDLIRLLSFSGGPTLSEHSQGVLGWALIIIPHFLPNRTETGQ